MRLTVMHNPERNRPPQAPGRSGKRQFAAGACMQHLRIQLQEKQKVPPEEMRTVRREQKRVMESASASSASAGEAPIPRRRPAQELEPPNGLAWSSAPELTAREFRCLMIRANPGRRRIPTPVPFLCDGHNIHGCIPGTPLPRHPEGDGSRETQDEHERQITRRLMPGRHLLST